MKLLTTVYQLVVLVGERVHLLKQIKEFTRSGLQKVFKQPVAKFDWILFKILDACN